MRHSRLNGLNAGEKICLLERVPRGLFIFLLLLCDSYMTSAPFRLNAVKHGVFRKSAAALIAFRFKRCQGKFGWCCLIKCVFSSCVLPESVGFVSRNVCACVIFGAGSRERGLWGWIKGLLIKNSRTVPWRETYLGKNINEWLRQRKTEQKVLFWAMRLFNLISTNICSRKN